MVTLSWPLANVKLSMEGRTGLALIVRCGAHEEQDRSQAVGWPRMMLPSSLSFCLLIMSNSSVFLTRDLICPYILGMTEGCFPCSLSMSKVNGELAIIDVCVKLETRRLVPQAT